MPRAILDAFLPDAPFHPGQLRHGILHGHQAAAIPYPALQQVGRILVFQYPIIAIREDEHVEVLPLHLAGITGIDEGDGIADLLLEEMPDLSGIERADLVTGQQRYPRLVYQVDKVTAEVGAFLDESR